MVTVPARLDFAMGASVLSTTTGSWVTGGVIGRVSTATTLPTEVVTSADPPPPPPDTPARTTTPSTLPAATTGSHRAPGFAGLTTGPDPEQRG